MHMVNTDIRCALRVPPLDNGDTSLVVRRLGREDYTTVWHCMQDFTAGRTPSTPDELWLVEHPPVYTLGRNGKREHVLDPGAIPVIPTDRGGQVTYHGPGQVVAYCLMDLARRGMGVRALVTHLEGAVIDVLAACGIPAAGRRDAPGVYVDGRKIAAIGLRIRRGCSYHGLSLNVDMDLTPFNGINPCGYAGLPVTQLRDEGGPVQMRTAADRLTARLLDRFAGDP
jgi:lipoyl(octanoyl) transferase